MNGHDYAKNESACYSTILRAWHHAYEKWRMRGLKSDLSFECAVDESVDETKITSAEIGSAPTLILDGTREVRVSRTCQTRYLIFRNSAAAKARHLI